MKKLSSVANELVELSKRCVASDLSVQELTAELKEVKLQLAKVTTEKLELLTKLNAVEAEFDKRLEELAVVRGVSDRIEDLGQFIVVQSVKALVEFINQVGTLLVDSFRSGL